MNGRHAGLAVLLAVSLLTGCSSGSGSESGGGGGRGGDAPDAAAVGPETVTVPIEATSTPEGATSADEADVNVALVRLKVHIAGVTAKVLAGDRAVASAVEEMQASWAGVAASVQALDERRFHDLEDGLSALSSAAATPDTAKTQSAAGLLSSRIDEFLAAHPTGPPGSPPRR